MRFPPQQTKDKASTDSGDNAFSRQAAATRQASPSAVPAKMLLKLPEMTDTTSETETLGWISRKRSTRELEAPALKAAGLSKGKGDES